MFRVVCCCDEREVWRFRCVVCVGVGCVLCYFTISKLVQLSSRFVRSYICVRLYVCVCVCL